MDKLFVINLTIRVDRRIYEPHLPAHLAYLEELERQGMLVLSGPYADRHGGMVIIRATTLDEAEAIAQADPLVASGVDSYTIREWLLTKSLPARLTI